MNHKSYLMIKCILPDNPVLIRLLTEALYRKINTQWPNLQLTIRSNDKYWKYEHTQYVIYNLSNITPIYVHELIKIFPVKWEYSENMVHDVDTHKRYNLEEADWNKNCMPHETFLISEVEWVHIYTWDE